MLGESLLIAPKLSRLNESQWSEGSSSYLVRTYFPSSSSWYFWYDSSLVKRHDSGFTDRAVKLEEQGIYIRAGTILPIKTQGQGLSILTSLKDPIKLSIYLDPVTQSASGSLYIDDGETFAYRTMGQRALFNFTYCNNTLYSVLLNRPARNSTFIDGFFIGQIELYGTNSSF